MKDKFQNILQKIKDLWNKYSKKTKIIAISAVSAILIVLVVVIAVMNTTKYELLCSGLSDKEESQIYSAVSSKNIPVKITGNAIYVKQGTANSLLMQLAEEGLPDGKLSYDIYSSGTNYAETDKDKDIKQIQQTQNRLQDTIETIPGVKQAIVNIAQNSNDTYVLADDKTPTTASVKLSLRNGTTLTKTQVNGIVQLVSKSVPGLATDKITIADSDGNALNGEVNGTDETADQLVMKSKYEATIKSKLVAMLDKVYGQGNANVTVNADIDYSKVSTVTNSYTSGVASVVTSSSEVAYAGSSLASGVTGVSGAQPAYPNTSNNSVATYSSKANTTTSYAVGSVQEAISRVGGKLNKLSIAVILNNKNAAAANADTVALKSTIANAAGANVQDISVEQMGFSSVMPSSSTIGQGFTFPAMGTANGKLIYMIIAALLLLIVFTTLFLVLAHKRKRRRAMLEEQALEEAEEEAQAAAAAQLVTGSDVPAMPAGNKPKGTLKSIEETINETHDNSYKKQIEDFADKKPELVAQILKNWLKD